MRKVILLGLIMALAGCNTIAGIGDDISGTAHKVGGMMN